MSQINVTILADSISLDGKRITTFELEYPRYIHAEVMTHRQFSRNAASSRAIPIQKAIDLVQSQPAMPIHWGLNQPGMQASQETEYPEVATSYWLNARNAAVEAATDLKLINIHKQVVNRILEPFQKIKVVLTATEFSNFFYLRSHPDAQPEIQALSDAMFEARNSSIPIELKPGEYHLPYIDTVRFNGTLQYLVNGDPLTLEQAIAVSASACAQVSYRVLDLSLDKALDIYKRLVEAKPVHASPFEHQATPISSLDTLKTSGVTHVDQYGNLWSGNFQGWIQHRQLIPGNVCTNYQG